MFDAQACSSSIMERQIDRKYGRVPPEWSKSACLALVASLIHYLGVACQGSLAAGLRWALCKSSRLQTRVGSYLVLNNGALIPRFPWQEFFLSGVSSESRNLSNAGLRDGFNCGSQ